MLEVFSEHADGRRLVGSVSLGGVLHGFHEQGTYAIQRPAPDTRLYIDDQPINAAPGDMYWKWSPGFYAGRVTAELTGADGLSSKRYYLEVAPDKDKIDKSKFERLLKDIADYLPEYLLGNEPAQIKAGGRSPFLSVWLAYARLRANAEAYINSLRELSEHSITRLRYRREHTDIHRVKRIDVFTIRSLCTNPELSRALRAKTMGEGSGTTYVARDTRVNAPFHEVSVDNPPNRLILKQINQVVRHAAWIGQKLENESDADSRPSLPRRLAFLGKINRQLRSIAGRQPFSSVSADDSLDSTGLDAVTANPLYDRAHKKGLSILMKGIREFAADEMLYLSSTWRLYEAWCFCVIAGALEDGHPNFQWKRHTGKSRIACMLEGIRGDHLIRLYDQMTCPSLEETNAYGYSSISKERIPDIILEYRTPSKIEFVCIDAKYRVGKANLLDAMSSAHIYQQSLRLNGNRPNATCLLSPHTRNVSRLSEPDYLDKYQVACLPLDDKADAKELLAILKCQFTLWH